MDGVYLLPLELHAEVGNVYSGRGSASSSVSSSVELQAENWLFIGGRTGGISIVFGPSTCRRPDGFGDGGVRMGNDRSGHDRGERDDVGR